MNITDWTPAHADELAKVLETPILKLAFQVVEGMTMASVLTGQGLLNVAQNGQTLFGYDVGHAAAVRDIQDLAKPAKEIKQVHPNYAGVPKEKLEQIVKTFPKPVIKHRKKKNQ